MAAGGRKDEAAQRAQYGGYSEAELDAALLRTQRSDPFSVGIRLLTLAAVYVLLARAIRSGLTAPFVILPLLLELLVVFWGGQVLKRLVDCKPFRQSAGSLFAVVAWTVAILALVLGMLSWDRAAGAPNPAQLPQAIAAAQLTVFEHGLHWALLAMVGGIAFGTLYDLNHWKRAGGVFVWTAITAVGFRLGLLLFGAAVIGIPAALFGPGLLSLLARSGWLPLLQAQGWAWPVWGALLLLDLAVVVVSVLMHCDLQAQAAGSKPAATPGKRSRLPG